MNPTTMKHPISPYPIHDLEADACILSCPSWTTAASIDPSGRGPRPYTIDKPPFKHVRRSPYCIFIIETSGAHGATVYILYYCIDSLPLVAEVAASKPNIPGTNTPPDVTRRSLWRTLNLKRSLASHQKCLSPYVTAPDIPTRPHYCTSYRLPTIPSHLSCPSKTCATVASYAGSELSHLVP